MDYRSSWGGMNSMGAADGISGQSYAAFFGYPEGMDSKQFAGRDFTTDHVNMPDYYADSRRIRYLEMAIEGLTVLDMDWTSTAALPMEYTNDLSWELNTLVFDKGLIDPVGHEGMPRTVKAGKRTMTARSMRHAVAAIFEYDFMTTPAGVQHYVLTMQQIRNMVQRTIAYDVIYALVHAQESEEAWQRKLGLKPGAAGAAARLAMEVDEFALFSKDPKGPEKYTTEMKARARRMGFEINMYVFPERLLHYITTAQHERTYYQFVGPSGYKAWIDAPEGDKSLDGKPVYTAPVFMDMELGDKPMLLTNNITIGECGTMWDTWADGRQDRRCAMDRAIRIYCQDSDRLVVISMGDGLAHCFRFDEEGRLSKVHHDLAKHNMARDMFLYQARTEKTNRVVEYWGQIDEKNLERRTIDNVVASMFALVTPEQRLAIDRLYGVFRMYSQHPSSFKRTAAEVAEIYASLTSIDAAQRVAMDHKKDGGLGSWFGLEALAHLSNDDAAERALVKEGIDAFVSAYNVVNDRLGAGTSNNMVLDSERCPVHLANFVVHKGPAALFEHSFAAFDNGVATPSIPLFIGAAAHGGSLPSVKKVSDRVEFYHATNSGTNGIKHLLRSEEVDYVAVYERVVALLQYKEQSADAETDAAKKKALKFSPLVFVHSVALLLRDQNGTTLKKVLGEASADLFSGDADALMQGYQGRAWDEITPVGIAGFVSTVARAAHVAATYSALPLVVVSDVIDEVMKELTGATASSAANFKLSPYVVHHGGSILDGAVGKVAFADFRTGYTTPMPTAVTSFENACDPLLRTKVHLPRRMQTQEMGSDVNMSDAMGLSRTTYAADAIALDDEAHFSNCPPFLANYTDAAGMSDPLKRAFRMAFLFARVTLPVCQAMIQNDMAIPFGFDILRPFQEQEMEMVIAMRGGPDTGKTMWGHSNVMFSQNAMNKLMFMHLSYYSKSIVFTANNILLLRNVGYAGYFGGAGSEFFDAETADILRNQDWVKREDQRVEGFPSLFACMRPSHRTASAPKRAIDIRGSESGEVDDKPHYPSAHFYRLALGFDTLRSGGRPGFRAYEARNTNSLVFQMRQESYAVGADGGPGKWVNPTRCDGHHGPNVQPGVRDVRAGKIQEMPKMELMYTH